MKPEAKRHDKFNLPIVRLAPRSNIETMMLTGSRLATILIGLVVLIIALSLGEVVLAPVFLAVVVGLMLGPLADRIERLGVPPWISGMAVVFLFVGLISVAATAFAVPLSAWIEKLPGAWTKIQPQIASWKDLLKSMEGLQKQVQDAMGQAGAINVAVQDGAAVKTVATVAPAIMAEMLIFLASLYFYVATRKRFRIAVLSLCFTRRIRWRTARIFRDVEYMVSRYLLSITMVNIGVGAAVSLALWLAGVPSPMLWGMLAGVLNYVTYVGPAVMAVLLLGIGLITADNALGILTPPAIYLVLHVIEGQIVTPHVLGMTMTLNPFVIFLALVFWIWIWGPVGGFIAVPSLLVLYVIARHLVPRRGDK